MNILEHIDKNYQAFKALLPGLMKTDFGRWAVMKDEKLIITMDTPRDAYIFATSQYGDEPYSIQEITDKPIHVLYHSMEPPVLKVIH